MFFNTAKWRYVLYRLAGHFFQQPARLVDFLLVLDKGNGHNVAMRTMKQHSLAIIQRLPDDCTIEEIMETLWVQRKIVTGREQIQAGRSISHEEAKRRLGKWLK